MTLVTDLERLAALQEAGRPALVWGVDQDLSAVGGPDAHRLKGGPSILLQALKRLDAAYVAEGKGLWIVSLTQAPPRSLVEVCGLTEDVVCVGDAVGVPGGLALEVGAASHPREVLAAKHAPILLRARALWWLGQLDAAVAALRPLLDAPPGTPNRLAGLQEWGRMLGCTDQLSLLSRLQDLSAREYPQDPVFRALGNPMLDESLAPETPLSLRVLSVMATDEATLKATHALPPNPNAVIAAVAASGNRSLKARVRLIKLGSAVGAGQYEAALALLPGPHDMTSEEMHYAGVCHLFLGRRDRALRFLKTAMTRYSQSLMVMGVYAAAAALAAGLREYGGLLVDRVQAHLVVAPHADAPLARLLVAGAEEVPEDRIRLWLAAGHAFEKAGLPTRAEAVREKARAEAWPIPLGEYDLLEPLGRGGRSRVFRAVHRPSGAHLAIKILHRGIDAEELRREAAVHARLHHPGVVRALDVGRVGEDAATVSDLEAEAGWFAMSIVPGVPTSTLAGRLGEARLRRVLETVLEGLKHCHARGVVHRDVKPENIMVDAHDRVYLIDFGLSPRSRRIAGSPAVMSPEQWVGRADARSDVYGLAASTVFLVSGVWPFVGGLEAMKRAHLEAPLPEVEGASEGLVRWIHRGMQKDPDDRYQTAAEALAALPEVLLLPGREEAVAVVEAVGEFEDAAQHGIGLVNRETPLVGRDSICEALWQAVQAGEGRIELRGAPGVGRTALLNWLRFSLRERGRSKSLESGQIRVVDGEAPDGPGLLVCAPRACTPPRGLQIDVPPLSVADLHDIALHVLALEPAEALRLALEAEGSPRKLRDLLSGAVQPRLPVQPPWPSIEALRHLVNQPIDDPTLALATMAAGLERMIEEGVPWNDPLWSAVESRRIVCLLNLGENHEAIAAARAQLDSPNRPGFNGRAWAHLSWSLREFGQSEEALRVALAGLEQLSAMDLPVARCELLLTAALLDPSASFLEEGWEMWKALGYPTQSPDPREIDANRRAEVGDIAGAIAVLDSPPERSNSLSALCGMLLILGDLPRAEQAGKRLVELGDPPVLLACVRVAQGRYAQARALCLEEHGRWSERERVACLVASRAHDPSAPVEALLPWLGVEFRVVSTLPMLAEAANRADAAGLSSRAAAIRRKLPRRWGEATEAGSA